jgi:hypothetical protein
MATKPTPPRGRKGEMTFSLQRLPEPLLLDQVVRDPAWDTFKTVMVVLGGIAVLSWLSFGSYTCGQANAVPATIQQPITIVAPPPPQQQVVRPTRQRPPAAEPAQLTPEELDRRYSEYLRNRDR